MIEKILKNLNSNTDLTNEEKQFASTLLISVSEMLTEKEGKDIATVAGIQNQINELKELKGMKDTAIRLQDQIDKMVIDNENLKNATKAGASTSIVHQIAEQAVTLYKSKNEKGAVKMDGNMELKSVIDMGLSTAITGQIPQADREAGINYEAERPISLLSLIPSGTTTSNKLEWIEKTDEEGAPAFRAEFLASPQRSWKSIVRSTDVTKLSVHAEFSKEIMDDVDYFMNEVRRDLSYQMQRALEQGIYNGNGTPPVIKGILEYAQAWDNGTVKIETGRTANIYDVIAWSLTQITKEEHTPNAIMINPVTFRKLKWTKDDNNNYILHPLASGTQVFEGVRIIVSNLIPVDEVLTMDLSRAVLYFKKNLELSVYDQHAENAIKDIIVVNATLRVALKIKNTDAKAFVYCNDIPAAITALQVPTT